MVKFLKVGKV